MHTAVYNLWLEQSSWFSIFTNKKYLKIFTSEIAYRGLQFFFFNCNEHMGEDNDLLAINIFPPGM